MDVTTLLFVRHGQTEWNANGRWQGHADVPLNETGRGQAAAIAQRLARQTEWKIDALYASDLERAAETAVIIGNAIGHTPIFDPIWRERDMGGFSGLTRPEIVSKYPGLLEDERSGFGLTPPNGEAGDAFWDRGAQAIRNLVANHTGQTVLVVSHGGFLYATAARLLGMGRENFGNLRFGNTSLSVMQIDDHHARLYLLNDMNHLKEPDLTGFENLSDLMETYERQLSEIR